MHRILTSAAAAFVIAATAMLAPVAASACDKNFTLYNETDASILHLYVSPHQSNTWEDDLITNNATIEPDTSWHINMSADDRDFSLYDVKALLDDGSKVVGASINICRATKVYVYNDHVSYE